MTKIMVNDCSTGASYERDMTPEEETQAEIDAQQPKPSDDLALVLWRFCSA
jgi:hypothetical protein